MEAVTEVTTEQDVQAIEEGDTLRVDYRGTRDDVGDGLCQTTEAEVVDAEFSEVQGYTYATFLLGVYRDEEDTIERRRVKVQPEASFRLEVRQTTINGSRWQRLNAPTSIEVSRVE